MNSFLLHIQVYYECSPYYKNHIDLGLVYVSTHVWWLFIKWLSWIALINNESYDLY